VEVLIKRKLTLKSIVGFGSKRHTDSGLKKKSNCQSPERFQIQRSVGEKPSKYKSDSATVTK